MARKAVIAAGFNAALRPFADQLALPSKLRLAKTVWSYQGEIYGGGRRAFYNLVVYV